MRGISMTKLIHTSALFVVLIVAVTFTSSAQFAQMPVERIGSPSGTRFGFGLLTAIRPISITKDVVTEFAIGPTVALVLGDGDLISRRDFIVYEVGLQFVSGSSPVDEEGSFYDAYPNVEYSGTRVSFGVGNYWSSATALFGWCTGLDVSGFIGGEHTRYSHGVDQNDNAILIPTSSPLTFLGTVEYSLGLYKPIDIGESILMLSTSASIGLTAAGNEDGIATRGAANVSFLIRAMYVL